MTGQALTPKLDEQLTSWNPSWEFRAPRADVRPTKGMLPNIATAAITKTPY